MEQNISEKLKENNLFKEHLLLFSINELKEHDENIIIKRVKSEDTVSNGEMDYSLVDNQKVVSNGETKSK